MPVVYNIELSFNNQLEQPPLIKCGFLWSVCDSHFIGHYSINFEKNYQTYIFVIKWQAS